MRRLTLLGALVTTFALGVAPATAHNAGCVQTGNGEWRFVGSNKESPAVSEHNPNTIYESRGGQPPDYYLDLQPGGPGDQYGARHAADRGNSAVERPSPTRCTPPASRA